MEITLKQKTNEYVTHVCMGWVGIVLSTFLYTLQDKDEVMMKYIMIAIFIVSSLKFLFSFIKLFMFIENYESNTNKEFRMNNIFRRKEVTQRSIFDYIKNIPYEQPFTLMSVMGLIMYNEYHNFDYMFQQALEQLPVIHHLAPPLPIMIMVMLLGNYMYHIKIKYLHRLLRLIIILFSPFIISIFVIGLISPLLLVIQGFFTLSSTDEFLMIFSDIKTLFWLLVYPITSLHLLNCNFINEYDDGINEGMNNVILIRHN
ncbi:hypothetical protein ACFSCX_06865 [Bacillus salitolerans]|uniref:Uncharacterized protein n=1 Tax=Bacillus salitolerans TaxID=1437434 RepID=A0ABW4LP65_9BACI